MPLLLHKPLLSFSYENHAKGSSCAEGRHCKQWQSNPRVTGLYFSRTLKLDATPGQHKAKQGGISQLWLRREREQRNHFEAALRFCCLPSEVDGSFKVTRRGHSRGLFLLMGFKWINSCPEVTQRVSDAVLRVQPGCCWQLWRRVPLIAVVLNRES